jgi:hypothetical protein
MTDSMVSLTTLGNDQERFFREELIVRVSYPSALAIKDIIFFKITFFMPTNMYSYFSVV